jgi:hypothetical protein
MVPGPCFGLQNAAAGEGCHEIEHTVLVHVDVGGGDHHVGEAAQFVGEDVDGVAGFVEEAAAGAAPVARGDDARAVEQHYAVWVIVDVEELLCEYVLRVAADFVHRVDALLVETVG